MLVRIAMPLALSVMLHIPSAYAHDICTAVADGMTGKMLLQNGECDTRVTPASTFKIAISLMGYDSDVLKDEHSPALPFHEGYAAWNPVWRTTTDPASWIRNSVVWYSQQVTTRLGDDRFQRYVTEFRYGNENVSGDPGKHNGLTRAWLNSSLKISPREQLVFMHGIVSRQLPVSAHAYEMTANITAVRTLANGWDIHGKTGTGFPTEANGTEDSNHAYGWFVGWASKGERTLTFVRLVQDDDRHPVVAGIRARDALMNDLPAILDSL
ncbi:MAG TPA: class D beta-lactamase [Paraburkholderia sp.]|jgi:beta-lactamase class D